MNEEIISPKPIFKSKTAVVNSIVLVAGFVPSVREFISANPEAVVTILAAINIALRLVTKGKIQIFN